MKTAGAIEPFARNTRPGNPALVLFALTFAILGVLMAAHARLPIGVDEAVQRDVRLHVASQDLTQRIDDAVKAGDIARAQSYRDLARFMGWPETAAPRASPEIATSQVPRAIQTSGVEPEMVRRLGQKTQAIVEVTGKRSLAAFDTTLDTFDFIVEHIVGFGAWLLALLGLAAGQRIVPFLRA